MSCLRRLLSMITASVAVLALGFVVAVAARTLPGEGGDEPFLDLDVRTDIDLTPVFAWILMILVVLVAVLIALGLRQTRPNGERRRRSILGTLLGLLLFVVIVRWLRPAVEALLEGGTGPVGSGTEVSADGRSDTTAGWLFSILLAAVLAAALTRIGLSIKTVAAPFPSAVESEVTTLDSAPVGPPPAVRPLGDDPRSRIINAYAGFENWLTAIWRPRNDAETTARHARRGAEEMSLDVDEVRDLVGHHSRARYGNEAPTESDAAAAERTSSRLQAGDNHW